MHEVEREALEDCVINLYNNGFSIRRIKNHIKPTSIVDKVVSEHGRMR